MRGILKALSQAGCASKGQPRPPGSLARVRLQVMAYTGLAPVTIMRLKPEHVDLRSGISDIRQPRRSISSPGT